MIHTLIHSTENKNLYIYDDQHRLSMLIHPELKKASEKGSNINPYYLNKYKYLKKNNFFSEPRPIQFETLDESIIKENITQTGQITYEVTDSCNLNCLYCSYGELYEGFEPRNHENINTQYSINLLKYIFSYKYKNKKNRFNISFYGGEPLLNINFIKQIVTVANQLKKEKEMNIDYSMTTNATLIHKHINFLAQNEFNLLISLDGDERNHSYRFFGKNKKNSFHQVINNIDMIQRDYPEYFINHVNFNAVLHNRNSIKDIYEFIYKRYNKIPRIAELSPNSVKSENVDLHSKIFNSRINSEREFLKEESNLSQVVHNELIPYMELIDFIKNYSINFYISNISTLLQNVEKRLPTGTCLPGHKRLFLTNRGFLLPCEKIDRKYSIGEVNENVMIDIPSITKQYNFYYDNIKKNCQNCYSYKFCGSCLFHIKNLDKVNTEDFVCDKFYDSETFKNKLDYIFSFLEKYPKDFCQIIENIIVV